MKRRLATLIAGALLMVASSAWSYSLTENGVTTQVGLQDTFIASGSVNSGDGSELTWINSVLTGKGLITANYEKADYQKYYLSDWKLVTGGIYALDLGDTPEYFLVKTGTDSAKKGGPPAGPDHFLFQNNADFEWAVVDMKDLNIVEVGGVNLSKISHLAGAGTAPVPEPGTMMLLGAGFLGLAVYGKRRRNA